MSSESKVYGSIVEVKVYRAKIGVARSNRMEMREINAEKGYLKGYSPGSKRKSS